MPTDQNDPTTDQLTHTITFAAIAGNRGLAEDAMNTWARLRYPVQALTSSLSGTIAAVLNARGRPDDATPVNWTPQGGLDLTVAAGGRLASDLVNKVLLRDSDGFWDLQLGEGATSEVLTEAVEQLVAMLFEIVRGMHSTGLVVAN